MDVLPTRDSTVLVVVDMQVRLLQAFPDEARTVLIHNVRILVEAAGILGLPIIATEQYPKGLGPTISEVRTVLGDSFEPVEKLEFSCGRAANFLDALRATGRRQVLLCGVETHVCALQTAVDLIGDDYRVFVAADAVRSRRDLDWTRGLAVMERAGATVGTTEMFLFQLLERAGTDEFRQVSKLLK